MKKLLTMFLGLGLLSQQAFAVSVLGENFAGYANTLDGTGGAVWVDLGGPDPMSPDYSNTTANITANITDVDAASWVVGNSAGAYLDLSFDAGVINGAGEDLKVFLVGGNGHTFDLTIGSETRTYSLAAGAGSTGAFDDLYGTDPIVALGINLDDFTTLSGPVSSFRMTIGDGWGCGIDTGLCSAVPSFIGSNYVVPVPAAVWLFGSGLIGLVGLARRRG